MFTIFARGRLARRHQRRLRAHESVGRREIYCRRLAYEPLEDRRVLSGGLAQAQSFQLSPAVFVENQGQWAELPGCAKGGDVPEYQSNAEHRREEGEIQGKRRFGGQQRPDAGHHIPCVGIAKTISGARFQRARHVGNVPHGHGATVIVSALLGVTIRCRADGAKRRPPYGARRGSPDPAVLPTEGLPHP
jgi:hypothetical protein